MNDLNLLLFSSLRRVCVLLLLSLYDAEVFKNTVGNARQLFRFSFALSLAEN